MRGEKESMSIKESLYVTANSEGQPLGSQRDIQ